MMIISCFKLILVLFTIITITLTNGKTLPIDLDCQALLVDVNESHLGLTLNELIKLYDKCEQSLNERRSESLEEVKRSPFSEEGIRFKKSFSPKEEGVRFKKSSLNSENIRFLRNGGWDTEGWFNWNPFSKSWFKRNPFSAEGIRFKKNPFEKEGIRFKKSVFNDEGIRYKKYAFDNEGIRYKKSPFEEEGIRYKKSPFTEEGIRFKKAFDNEGIRYKKSPFTEEGIRFKKSDSYDSNSDDLSPKAAKPSISGLTSIKNSLSKKSPFNEEGIRF